MELTRRQLAGLAAAAVGSATPARPIVCFFSKGLPKLHYSELGGVLQALGFEGCDLTVRPGGHVLPEKAPADLIRAVESIRGEGVEVPMITTSFTSAAEPHASNTLALAGQYMKVPFFKPGYWRYGKEPLESTLLRAKQELAGLAALGRACGITAGVHNHAGEYVGQAVWDYREVLNGLDQRWVGYYFDPCHATAAGGAAGCAISLRIALPRLKMLAVKDFVWEKVQGKWRTRPCPPGEGVVDWPKVFATLAAARFTGPISLDVNYEPAGDPASIGRALAWLKKQIAAAYGPAT